MEQLIPTLSTSLVMMTCVEMSTHSRGLVAEPAPMHVQDGHQLVRGTPSQCKQPTVVGTIEEPRGLVSDPVTVHLKSMLLEGFVYVIIVQNCCCWLFYNDCE